MDFLKGKVNIHVVMHDCNVFMHNGALCYLSKLVKNFLQEKNVNVFAWPEKFDRKLVACDKN